jgi:hypothetical protein
MMEKANQETQGQLSELLNMGDEVETFAEAVSRLPRVEELRELLDMADELESFAETVAKLPSAEQLRELLDMAAE